MWAVTNMKARDLMSSPVVSVSPDTPVSQVASTLLKHRITGVPVVDAGGSLVGMVSDGDLIGRDDAQRQARWDWWLGLLAGSENIHPEWLSQAANRVARDIMSAPVITINEDAEPEEVARLMTAYHVKRLPVVRAGRMCGIVARADLQRALAQGSQVAGPAVHKGFLENIFAALDHGFAGHTTKGAETQPAPTQNREDKEARFDATGFRQLVSNFEHKESLGREHAQQVAAEERRARVTKLIDRHITGEDWRTLIHKARKAAENGEKEFMLLRFPSQLCTDGGRSINVGEADWPGTLRGEAAEIYLRWERDLKPRGFHLSAIILDFPDGLPGDVGLYLLWG